MKCKMKRGSNEYRRREMKEIAVVMLLFKRHYTRTLLAVRSMNRILMAGEAVHKFMRNARQHHQENQRRGNENM